VAKIFLWSIVGCSVAGLAFWIVTSTATIPPHPLPLLVDRFRLVFNHERPHEALANETPGSIYVPSTRLLPNRVASFQYPRSFQTRRVNNSGDISWHKGRVFVSEVFRNEEIGLEQMDEDIHRVFFCNTELGEFNSSEMRFRPALRA